MLEARLLAFRNDGYILYCVKTKKIIHSRDVIFQEFEPPKPSPATVSYDLDRQITVSDDVEAYDRDAEQRHTPMEFLQMRDRGYIQPAPASLEIPPPPTPVYPIVPPVTASQPAPQPASTQPSSQTAPLPTASQSPVPAIPAPIPAIQELRRSSRIRKPSRAAIESIEYHNALLDDEDFQGSFIIDLLASPPEFIEVMSTSIPAADKLSEPPIPDTVVPDTAPETIAEALSRPDAAKWRTAIKLELDHHLQNGIWRILDREKRMRVLPLRWVLKVKRDGTYKARLVVKGFRQRYGQDYHEVYAAVAKPITFKVLVALSARFRWPVYYFDITSAFLHAELREQVFIDLLETADGPPPAGKVGQLLKTLYGLKQSPMEWYTLLSDALLPDGFIKSHADHSLFFKPDKKLYMLIYVDDVLAMAPDQQVIDNFKTTLQRSFKIGDNRPFKDYLGIKVIRIASGVLLSQLAYVKKILKRFGMSNCHGAATLYNEKVNLQPFSGRASTDEVKDYQAKIGCLIWLIVGTRVDIAWAVCKLARFAANPGPDHFIAVQSLSLFEAIS